MLNVNIDLDSLAHLADTEAIQKIGDKAAADLALLTQAKVQELAGERLHSRLEMFRKGLSLKQEESGVWLIHLDDELAWIEDGMPAHSMLPDLLASPKAKMSKDGSKYMIVPFQNKAGRGGATQNTPVQQGLVSAIKQQLKQAKVPWAKIEKDDQGRPKLGRLHKLHLVTPNKPHAAPPGHGRGGMGWGAIGAPMIGATGIPFLQGAGVYQSIGAGGKVERSVMTFRVASEKHMGSGRWEYPGIEPTHILQNAYEWALQELEHLMPEIVRQIGQLGNSNV